MHLNVMSASTLSLWHSDMISTTANLKLGLGEGFGRGSCARAEAEEQFLLGWSQPPPSLRVTSEQTLHWFTPETVAKENVSLRCGGSGLRVVCRRNVGAYLISL